MTVNINKHSQLLLPFSAVKLFIYPKQTIKCLATLFAVNKGSVC